VRHGFLRFDESFVEHFDGVHFACNIPLACCYNAETTPSQNSKLREIGSTDSQCPDVKALGKLLEELALLEHL
jgi:hypothetical protein